MTCADLYQVTNPLTVSTRLIVVLVDSLTGMSFEQKIGRSDGGRINVQIRPR